MKYRAFFLLFLVFFGSKAQSDLIREIDSLENNLEEIQNDSLWIIKSIEAVRKWESVDLSKAELKIQETHARALATNDPYLIGKAKGCRGIVSYLLGENDSALEDMQEALSIFKDLDKPFEIANCYNDLSVVKRRLGLIEESLDFMKKSYELRVQLGMKSKVINSVVNIANTYNNLNQHSKALEYLKKLDDYDQALFSDRQLMALYHTFSATYFRMDSLEKSEEYAVKTVDLASSKGNLQNESRGYILLGLINKNKGHYKESITLYLKALEIQKKMADTRGIPVSHNNLGKAYMFAGDFDKSFFHLHTAKNFNIASNNEDFLEKNYFNLLITHAGLNNIDSLEWYDNKYSLLRDKRFSNKIASEVGEWEVKMDVLVREKELLKEKNKSKNLTIIVLASLLVLILLTIGYSKSKRIRKKLFTILKIEKLKTKKLQTDLDKESKKSKRIFSQNEKKLIEQWDTINRLNISSGNNIKGLRLSTQELFELFDLCYPNFASNLKKEYPNWSLPKKQLKLCKLYSMNWFDTSTIVATEITVTNESLKQLRRQVRLKLKVDENHEIFEKLEINLR